jgi:hypothetical protein
LAAARALRTKPLTAYAEQAYRATILKINFLQQLTFHRPKIAAITAKNWNSTPAKRLILRTEVPCRQGTGEEQSGGAMAEREKTEILEQGDIFFLYRPDVCDPSPEGLDEVQRFYIVLRPRGGKLRLMVIGRKRLPDIARHGREWGFVDMVTDSASEIEKELREVRYETKTRGERILPAARPAGEGVYQITLEDGTIHLVYSLELPREPNEVQKAFHIPIEASYALSIKNPEKGQPKNAGLSRAEKANYCEELQKEFRGRRFESEDVRHLDYEGAEFVLVGARANPEPAYGVHLEPEEEDYRHAEAIQALRMVKSRHPVEPLFEGAWA